MAASLVETHTATERFDRDSQSPSPLSRWRYVSPEPHTEHSNKRTVFTILADDTSEFSPRPPNPELQKLEAKGMVNLSSPDTLTTSTQTYKYTHLTNVTNSCIDAATDYHNSNSDAAIVGADYNDIVVVTDKLTQTDVPWPIAPHYTDIHVEATTNKQSTQERNPVETKHSPKGDSLQHSNPDDGDKTGDESPTLKVEYVGKVWDAYINDFLLASDHITEAAIYDKATKSCIACSDSFILSRDEFTHILQSVNCVKLAHREGVCVNKRHYKTLLADGRRGLMAKDHVTNDGCSVCQTRTLVLVAVHDRKSRGRRCNDELMRLGDFFWAKGL